MHRAFLLLAGAAVLTGCDLVPDNKTGPSANEVTAAAGDGGLTDPAARRLCASAATYERLKILAFEEARRVRGIDAAPLDSLSRATVVRMEQPLVRSRDEGLGTTVCSGRLVVELPPNAARHFNGMQRLVADVEHSAQEAADGSGPVFQMSGAEPIIFRLASFGGVGGGTAIAQAEPAPQPSPPSDLPEAGTPDRYWPSENKPAPAPPPPAPAPRPLPPVRQAERPPAPPRTAPAPRPASEPAPVREASARPSYNCRFASTPSERAICADADLAARDRRMASAYYRAYHQATPIQRRQLSRSRADFLRRRERCADDACIADVYDARIAEIGRIASE